MKLKIKKMSSFHYGSSFPKFSEYANFVTNMVSGSTDVMFELLVEDEKYRDLLRSLFKRQCPIEEAHNELKKYVENNF